MDGELSLCFEISGFHHICVLFLETVDWIINHAAHGGCCGLTVGKHVYTNLDFANDVSLLASLLDMSCLHG